MSQLSVCLLDWPLLNVTAMYHHYSSFNHHVKMPCPNFTIMIWYQAKAVAPGERIPVPWLPLARPGRPWLWCKVSHFTLSLSHLIKCQTVVFWLLNSDSIKCHPAMSRWQICRVTYYSVSVDVLNIEDQANGDAGGAVQHRQDHFHPVPAGTGERLLFNINNLTFAVFQPSHTRTSLASE